MHVVLLLLILKITSISRGFNIKKHTNSINMDSLYIDAQEAGTHATESESKECIRKEAHAFGVEFK